MMKEKPVRALLVDDEKVVRSVLLELLQKHFPHVQVVGEAGNIPEAVREINAHKPDLVFLDIEMPGYTGLQLPEFFNPGEVTFDIVFVTAFNEYAIQAFKISAFDYLLKPVNLEELTKTLQRYQERQHAGNLPERMKLLKESFSGTVPDRIAVSSLHTLDFIDLDNIIVFEASGTYTKIVLRQGETLVASKPLGEFESVLQGNPLFFRAHRSYLVNLKHIRKISTKEGDIILLEKDVEVPLSR